MSSALDRLIYGLDPEYGKKVVAYCDHCGEPIVEGEGYYELNYEYVHEVCARDYAWEIADPVHHE